MAEDVIGSIESTCSKTVSRVSSSSTTTGGGVGLLRSLRTCSFFSHLPGLRINVIGSTEVVEAGISETKSITA